MKQSAVRMWWEFFLTPVSIDRAGGALDNRQRAAKKDQHPERITEEDFVIEVQKFTNPEDFKRHKSNLDQIAPRDYSLFLLLMLFGMPMGLSPAVIDQIKEIREDTGLMDEEIIKLLPKFSLIIMMLEGR